MSWWKTARKTEADKSATAAEARSSKGPPQPCEGVSVEIAEGSAARWHPLLEALRRRADQRRALRSARSAERELPFRDVILKGPFDAELLRARDLRTLLRAEFADVDADFHTLSVYANNENEIKAFFGTGVFAPDDEDRQVADLEFCWSKPGQGNSTYVVPMLDQQRPAAWYAGQMGVAVGLFPNSAVAPAYLDGASAEQQLPDERREAYLFIGRRDRLSTPVIEVHCADVTQRAAVAGINVEWWLRDGYWQPVDILLGQARFKLWFRLTSRNGDATFLAGSGNPVGRQHRRILVRGVLLPELPTLAGLSRLWFGEATRWAVEFDSRGRLRSNEISELAHSVVARWGKRFGIYQHRTARWLPRGRAFDAVQTFELSGGSEITHRYFPGRFAGGNSDQAWREIYGRKWSLLQFADEKAFGYLDFLPRATEIIGSTEPGTPVRTIDDREGAKWYIGLDWLNRAAHVQIADQALGLGDYWGRLWRTEIDAEDAEWLDVHVTSASNPAESVEYRIARGEKGPLGPLYIEYNPL
jgi:hypothetical protein